EVPTVPEGMALMDLINTFKTKDVSYLHVVNMSGDLTGIISFRDIRGMLEEEGLKKLIIAKDVATTEMVTVGLEDNIQVALRLMSEWGISQVPVLGGDSGKKVLGALREKDVISAYDKAVIRREIEAA
ncbi:MAG: CBS domain-containing protein, partial [Thermodesulfobacteriota bacterium]|nr:CBS domain-containing protein [Thermodesulfobacteriota bacterium]